jgi:hypothetical protein
VRSCCCALRSNCSWVSFTCLSYASICSVILSLSSEEGELVRYRVEKPAIDSNDRTILNSTPSPDNDCWGSFPHNATVNPERVFRAIGLNNLLCRIEV